MRTYLSAPMTNGKSYIKRVWWPIFGTCTAMITLPIVMGFLIAANGGIHTPAIQWLIAALLILCAAGASAFLVQIGNRAYKDALVFCLDDQFTLYVLDARTLRLSSGRFRILNDRSVLWFFRSIFETGYILNSFIKDSLLQDDLHTGKIKAYALQVTRIVRLQHVSNRRYLLCDAISANGIRRMLRYDITDHTQELFELLVQLSPTGQWDTNRRNYSVQIVLSAALLLTDLGLCITSHPAVGLLPETLYFPCLFTLEIPVILLGILITKRRKGE